MSRCSPCYCWGAWHLTRALLSDGGCLSVLLVRDVQQPRVFRLCPCTRGQIFAQCHEQCLLQDGAPAWQPQRQALVWSGKGHRADLLFQDLYAMDLPSREWYLVYDRNDEARATHGPTARCCCFRW